MRVSGLHHIAIIASDYERSKRFYIETLGFALEAEYYRAERSSWLGRLALNGSYLVELFSFPSPPPRATMPEAQGLRHLAFAVEDATASWVELTGRGVPCEPIRVDENTGNAFFFFHDPDGLPLEIQQTLRG